MVALNMEIEKTQEQKTQKNEGPLTIKELFEMLLLFATFILCIYAIADLTYEVITLPTPIKKDIEGSWKLVDHMNFEGYQKAHDSLNLNFEKFSENLRFDTLPDGRLVQTGGGSPQIIEDSTKKIILYEEDNHLKSYRTDYSMEDRFVKDGKLIRIDFFEGGVTKRIYERI